MKDFNETFRDELTDPEFRAAYLQASLEEGGIETFLIALKDVARANNGVAQENSELPNIQTVLDALGLRLAVVPTKLAA